MKTGIIKFFDLKKGFGFIIDDQTGSDLFFHITNTKSKDLTNNDKVSYDVEHGKRGPLAVSVTKIQ